MSSGQERTGGATPDLDGPALLVAAVDAALEAALPTFAGLWSLVRSPAALAAIMADPDCRRYWPEGRRLLVAPVDAALIAASIPFQTCGAGGPFPDPSPRSMVTGTGFLPISEPVPQLLARETVLTGALRVLPLCDLLAATFTFEAPAPLAVDALTAGERRLHRRYGEPFVAVPGGPAGGQRFVAPASLRVADLYPEAVAPPGSEAFAPGVASVLIEGDDLPISWADAMLRAETADRAMALFERLDARPPVPIEVLPRVQRWWLPASGHLVELRGRGTLQTARLGSPDDGRRALASMVAVASRPELELAFAGLVPVGGLEMALNGAIWLELAAGFAGEERYRVSTPGAIAAALCGLPGLDTVAAVDARLASLGITGSPAGTPSPRAVERTETALDGGRPRVLWRLRECGAALLWEDGLRPAEAIS